jgi:hypothetical protein
MNSGTENTVLSDMEMNKIKGFFAADAKYDASPIPTTLPREQVLAFTRSKLAHFPSREEVNKISELVIFYNLKETEEAFLKLFQNNMRDRGNLKIACTCIITLAWISETEQQQQLLLNYKNLLQRLSFPEGSANVLRVCNALSSPQAVDMVKSWLQIQANTLEQQIQKPENQQNPGKLSMLKGRQKQIGNIMNDEMKELEQIIQERSRLHSIPRPEEKISPLATLYMGNNEEQKYWSAIKLIRITEDNEEIQKQIASQFLNLSQTYAVDELRYEELGKKYEENSEAKLDDIEYARLYGAVMKRERCLYAAEFFKGTLDSTQSTWLKKQDDDGTNLLALRPDWKYPVSSEE